MYNFNVPEEKQVRVIISTDIKGEADDHFAVAHALLTPKFDIKGIIGSMYNSENNNMQMCCEESEKLLALMGLSGKVKVYHGATKPIVSENEYEYSDGAKLIVSEALKEDDRPLFVMFLGPMTDLACAYLSNPEIAGRFTAVIIAGGEYPEGCYEYNMGCDIKAANVAFRSNIELWQIPISAYSKMRISFSELNVKVRQYGETGRYLFEQMVAYNEKHAKTHQWINGESWCLGDSPAVGVVIDPMYMRYVIREAPQVDKDMKYHFSGTGRKIRAYNSIDSRFILEDFFAKLKLNYGS